jgi:tetratricopeptide (TPR) repeat protein
MAVKQYRGFIILVLINCLLLGIAFGRSLQIIVPLLAVYIIIMIAMYLGWERSNDNWRKIWISANTTFNAILTAEIILYFFMNALASTLAPSSLSRSTFTVIAVLLCLVLAVYLTLRLFLALYLILSEKYNQSLPVLNVLLSLNPKNGNLLFWRALANQRLMNDDAALADYGAVIRSWPKKKGDKTWITASLVNRALILIERRLLDAALKDIDLAHEIDPNYAFAYKLHALILLEWENYDAALESINDAIELDKDSSFYLTKSAILSEMERYPEALAVLDEGKALTPSEESFDVQRAIILLVSGDAEATIRFCDDFLSQDLPETLRETMRLNRSAAYVMLEQYDNASPEYQRLLKLELPDPYKQMIHSRAAYGLGVIAFKHGDYAAAEKYFSAAHEFSHEYSVALLGTIAAQMKQGREAAARYTWGKFKAIPSKNQHLKRFERDKTFPPEILELIRQIAQ